MNEPELENISIVVVDDEEIYLSLVSDALEDQNYRVKTASSAPAALKIIKSEKIDLIITDIRMPNMTGIELLKNAREINPHIGAIFMTGYANLNSAKDAIKQGAFDYISKPFELNEIRQSVKKAIYKIKEEEASSNSEKQLDSLSDLSQILIAVGDKDSLATTSLKFIMMHYQAKAGTVIFWNSDKTKFKMITLQNKQTVETELPSEDIKAYLEKAEQDKPTYPLIIESAVDSPSDESTRLVKCFHPSWLTPETQMLFVPIRRADTLYGFQMIGPFDKNSNIKGADPKYLAITSNQLAVSLENLSLLEETQKAYARLKEIQDETIQLEKMATRGEMSAEIGHELNNFLGVVAGNLSLMEFQIQRENYDKAGQYIQGIKDNIEKMKIFTSNLMDLRQISSAKEVINFEKLITEVIDSLEPQKRFNGVKITLQPIEENIPFEADSVHIQQVLYNLFNNAADATAGCDTREITAGVNLNYDTNSFTVHINDTGTGFEPENLKKAFEVKFTTKENGHGHGLLVCKRIIDNHGGKLDVDSTPGEGTSIKIEFPLSEQTAKEIASV